MRQHKKPIDASYLNLVLSLLHCIFVLVLLPLVYVLQGIGADSDWAQLYPSSSVSMNFFDGMKCFLGTLDLDEAQSLYPEQAQCRWSLLIVLVHVASIVVVNISVDKIVHAGATEVMHRGISAGIILGVMAMYAYEYLNPVLQYGSILIGLNLVCTCLVIVGSESYHSFGIHDNTFETVYPDFDDLYGE